MALLCYNQLVGEWMRQRIEQASPALPNLVAGRAIRVMAEMTGVRIPPAIPPQHFWETELPEELEERLTDPDFKAAALFDYLVLDEAQDLLARPRLWQCLLSFFPVVWKKVPLRSSAISTTRFSPNVSRCSKSLATLDASGRPVRWRLLENCRNYRIVGDTAVRLAGLSDPVYSGYMRSGGGVHNYDIFFYEEKRNSWTGSVSGSGSSKRMATNRQRSHCCRSGPII